MQISWHIWGRLSNIMLLQNAWVHLLLVQEVLVTRFMDIHGRCCGNMFLTPWDGIGFQRLASGAFWWRMPTDSLSPHKMGIYYRCISTYDYSNGDEISDFVYLSFPKCYHITYSFKPPTHDQQIYIYINWQHPILGGVLNSKISWVLLHLNHPIFGSIKPSSYWGPHGSHRCLYKLQLVGRWRQLLQRPMAAAQRGRAAIAWSDGGIPTPLKNMTVTWDDYPIYYGK